MTKKPALAAVAALASGATVGGCVIEDKNPPGTSASADLNLLLLVVDRSGTITDTFERKVDVYIDLLKLDAATAVTSQDFAFKVVDPVGTLLSETTSRVAGSMSARMASSTRVQRRPCERCGVPAHVRGIERGSLTAEPDAIRRRLDAIHDPRRTACDLGS